MGCAAPNQFHWKDLRQAPIHRVLNNKKIEQLGKDRFVVQFVTASFLVDSSRETISELFPNPGSIPSLELQILLIQYLLCDLTETPGNDLISEKELPGGASFFRGPHSLPIRPLLAKYHNDANGFIKLSNKIHARILGHGDASFYFEPLAGIGLSYILWQSDDEFPASISVLLDRALGRCLKLDTIFLLIRQTSLFLAGI